MAERRLLFPHRGRRRRPRAGPGQTRQGRRRNQHQRAVPGRFLRQGPVGRRHGSGETVRTHRPSGRRLHNGGRRHCGRLHRQSQAGRRPPDRPCGRPGCIGRAEQCRRQRFAHHHERRCLRPLRVRARYPRSWTAPVPWSPASLPSAAFQAKLLAVDPSLKDVSYAAETYDAVTLAALAAARAQDDAGRSIAANLIPVSGGTAAPGPRNGRRTVPDLQGVPGRSGCRPRHQLRRRVRPNCLRRQRGHHHSNLLRVHLRTGQQPHAQRAGDSRTYGLIALGEATAFSRQSGVFSLALSPGEC